MPPNRSRYTTSSYMGVLPEGCQMAPDHQYGGVSGVLSGWARLQRHVSVLLALSPEAALRNLYVWQVFTYMFVHFGTFHLLFNMLGLWFFGVPIEQSWGMRRFLKFYFYCGLAAGVCVLAANIAFGEWMVVTIGASGAIFGVLVAFGILFPDTSS